MNKHWFTKTIIIALMLLALCACSDNGGQSSTEAPASDSQAQSETQATTPSTPNVSSDITSPSPEEEAPDQITIRGVEYSTSLTSLSLFNMNLIDAEIVPLQHMTSLTELSLGMNNISDITPLADLTNLTKLDLSNNRISDITVLASLTNLYSLNINRNDTSDWSSVAHVHYVFGMQEPVEASEIIAKAIARGYQDRWSYSPYTGFHVYGDCRDYLVLFLYNHIGFTTGSSIVLDTTDMEEHFIDELQSAPYNTREIYHNYRFRIQMTNDANSEEISYYIENSTLKVHDQYGSLLNPDGWPWLDSSRILTQEEAIDRLWNGGGAARWYEYSPEKNKTIEDTMFYCYATYTWPEFNSGESHTGYIWVNSVTGKFEAYDNPLFGHLSNQLFDSETETRK